MTFRSHILRCLAGFALLLQIGLPLAQAQAAAKGVDLAALMCNPSGRIMSTADQAAVRDLLIAAGADVQTSDDGPSGQTPDCDRCVTAHVAVPAVTASLNVPTAYNRLTSERPPEETLGPITPRGPPCGTRAPPLFV